MPVQSSISARNIELWHHNTYRFQFLKDFFAEEPSGCCCSRARFLDLGGAGPTAAGNSCRKGVDAMSGVNGEFVLASPKACIEPVVGEVVNIVIEMTPIHKIHAYL